MKKFVIVIISLGFILSCRYKDGPLFSLRSSKNRLFDTHTLIKYTIDGIDSLNSFYGSLGLTFKFYYDHHLEENVWEIIGNRKDGQPANAYYYIDFTRHKKAISIWKVFVADGIGPFSEDVKNAIWNWEWEITKLEKDDIVMRTNYNGKEYIIELN